MSARRGSHRMDRFPNARGPHSIRPWNQPTTLPSAMAAAVSLQSAALVLQLGGHVQPAAAELAPARAASSSLRLVVAE
jgi:hypothetical protein